MGGGRDNSGARLYKNVNGNYVRVASYKDKVKEANRLIDDYVKKTGVNNYIKNEDVVLGYVKAINDRDRQAVLKLDSLFGKLTNDKKELLDIRKALLSMAKNSPKDLNKIMADKQKNISRAFVNSYGYILETKDGDKIVLTGNPIFERSHTNPVNVTSDVLSTIKKLRAQQIYLANFSSSNMPEFDGSVVSQSMNELVSQLNLPYQYNYSGKVSGSKWSNDITRLLGTIGYQYYVSSGM